MQHGLFSKDLLQHWKSVEKFYLIDVWRKQENYNDTANVLNSEQQKIFETANENVKPWAHKIVFLRMTSTEAANQLDDNSLDFVFLDGRHDYCGLKEDLINYWPKVKLGGIVAGHDYQYAKIDNANNWGICSDGTFSVLSVKGAVNEFSATHCAFVHQLGDSWMLFK